MGEAVHLIISQGRHYVGLFSVFKAGQERNFLEVGVAILECDSL